MPSIRRSQEVKYSPEKMYNLVNQIDAYPQFLPWCGGARILSQDEDTIKASITVAGGGFSRTFSTLNRLKRDKMIEIQLLDGPFKYLEGFWLFEVLPSGGCLITVALEFEFSGRLLDFAFSPFFHQAVNSMVDAFCRRAELIYQ